MSNIKVSKPRQLKDLISVGTATLKDFEILEIETVEMLAKQEPRALYLRLCNITRKNHDICVQDVFSAAIAQARNRALPMKKCQWWYWSQLRKKNNDKG